MKFPNQIEKSLLLVEEAYRNSTTDKNDPFYYTFPEIPG